MNVLDALDKAVAAIDQADSLALACHVSPDGDALGSLMAMHHLCRENDKPSVASWPSPFEVAPHYRFLPGLDLAIPPSEFPTQPVVMLTFDCGSARRLGDLQPAAVSANTLIVVDHHASNDCYGTINLVDPAAAASAVMVRRLARGLGWPLTRDVAQCLYTGLVTDTGRFQYSNTTPEVFSLARELAAFDLPIAEMSRELFEKHRFAYLQLAAEALSRAQLDTATGFVVAAVTAGDFARHGVHIDESEGLIDLVRRTAEAEVACVVKEAPEGVRVSLRSITEIDVAAIATRFGGGGHRFAAGFTSERTVDEVIDMVHSAVRDAVAGARSS